MPINLYMKVLITCTLLSAFFFAGCQLANLMEVAEILSSEADILVHDIKAVRKARTLALRCDFKDRCFKDGLDDIMDDSCQHPEDHEEQSEQDCLDHLRETLEWLYEEQKAYYNS